MGNVNEDLRKTVQAIRDSGSKMNMSLPVSRLKSEALKIKASCEKLLSMLDGDVE